MHALSTAAAAAATKRPSTALLVALFVIALLVSATTAAPSKRGGKSNDLYLLLSRDSYMPALRNYYRLLQDEDVQRAILAKIEAETARLNNNSKKQKFEQQQQQQLEEQRQLEQLERQEHQEHHRPQTSIAQPEEALKQGGMVYMPFKQNYLPALAIVRQVKRPRAREQ